MFIWNACAFRECVFVCVSACPCVCDWVLVHVCTQTINMIKKTETKKIQYTKLACIHTHRWGWWWWLNRLEWQKWRHSRIVFSPSQHFKRVCLCLYLCRPVYLFVCDYFDIYTYHFFFCIFSFSFSVSLFLIFGRIFLTCPNGSSAVFSVFIFCTLRINLPKA